MMQMEELIIQDQSQPKNPRWNHKNKLQNDYTVKHVFKWFKKKYNYSKLYTPIEVDYKTYKAVISDFNKEVWNKILYESGYYKIPLMLGLHKIQKKKMKFNVNNIHKGLRVDWKLTKENNKVIYHLNDNRENHQYRVFWGGKKRFINQSLYSFTPTRKIKRTLAKILKTRPDLDFTS